MTMLLVGQWKYNGSEILDMEAHKGLNYFGALLPLHSSTEHFHLHCSLPLYDCTLPLVLYMTTLFH